MTLSSLLSLNNPQPTSQNIPNHNFMPLPDLDRTHWSGGKGKWKAPKKNPNAALSALTLLAFLFFLNILQSCLKDTIGQNNGMMMMVLPANLSVTRFKRGTTKDKSPSEEFHSDIYTNWSYWTDSKMIDFINGQVELHWNTAELNFQKFTDDSKKRMQQGKDGDFLEF